MAPNRDQRRHPEQPERDVPPSPDRPQSSQSDLVQQGAPDVLDPRTKNSGHGKKTADKWNQ